MNGQTIIVRFDKASVDACLALAERVIGKINKPINSGVLFKLDSAHSTTEGATVLTIFPKPTETLQALAATVLTRD